MAAAQFSDLLGKRNHMRRYQDAAKGIKKAAMEHLFDEELNAFIRIAKVDDQGQLHPEKVVDSSSLFGLWYFGMLDQDHSMFQGTLEQVQQRLKNPTELGGYIRYEDDAYFRSTDKPNPWFITTMWEAQRRLQQDEVTDHDLEYVRRTLDWVEAHAYPSGVLAEQLHPYTRESLSATPLVWSHAVYVETTLLYIKALEKRGLCVECQIQAANQR